MIQIIIRETLLIGIVLDYMSICLIYIRNYLFFLIWIIDVHTLALKVWFLEQQHDIIWEIVEILFLAPTQTSWISISIVTRLPRVIPVYIKIGEALHSLTFAVLTSQKCVWIPNIVPFSVIFGSILVFFLTKCSEYIKRR